MSTDLATLANQLPADIREQIAKEIANDIQRVGSTGGKDQVRVGQDKKFEMPDGTKVDSFEAHVVGFVYRNEYYDKPYNKNNPSPPACFAIGESEGGLIASDNSPSKQGQECVSCQWNEFGSDPNGNGKACKNNVFIALLPTDDQVSEHDIWVMKISPTGIRPFNKYVKTLLQQNVPLSLVRTRIFCDEDTSYASVRMEAIGFEADNYSILQKRKPEAITRLSQEPDLTNASA